jgi:hypothetical protein
MQAALFDHMASPQAQVVGNGTGDLFFSTTRGPWFRTTTTGCSDRNLPCVRVLVLARQKHMGIKVPGRPSGRPFHPFLSE